MEPSDGQPHSITKPTLQNPTELNRNNLKASAGDGAAFGAMVGAGETYLPAFALAAGLGEVVAGLVASVPLAIGGWLQLLSLRSARWCRSEKQWILYCASMQASVFLMLAGLAWTEQISSWSLLALATLYWASGLAAGPSWNTWIGQMVPAKIRPNFFGIRTLACQAATVVGLVAGGWLITYGGGGVTSFIFPFTLAAAMRFVSVFLLGKHHLPQRPFGDDKRLYAATDESPDDAGRRLIIYLVVTQGMVQLIGPYIAPLMLHHLGMSYGWFVILTGAAFAAKAVALRVWPRFVSDYGATRLLQVGGVGLIIIPVMWLFSWHPIWLLVTQIFTGFLTAAYELGFMLMFFETLPAARRTSVLTWYNAANTSAWCLGSAIGGWWLWQTGGSNGAYTGLLAISAFGRAGALCLLFGFPATMAVRLRLIFSKKFIVDEDETPNPYVLEIPAQHRHRQAG